MSINVDQSVISPGWYPDPADSESLRWWDGSGWTIETKGSPSGDVHDSAGTADSTGTMHSTGSSAVEAFAPVAVRTEAALPPIDPYRPNEAQTAFGSTMAFSGTSGLFTVEPMRAYTAAVWWLALLPIWWLAIQVILLIALGDHFTPFLQLFVGIVVLLVAAGLTMRDRRVLLDERHPDAASTWWFLLGPLAYLIARGVHVYRNVGRGWAPLIVYVLCTVVPLLALLALSSLLALMIATLG